MKRQFFHRINPFRDIVKTVWENRDQLGYANRILKHGVCDGCALGTAGMLEKILHHIGRARALVAPSFDFVADHGLNGGQLLFGH